MQSIPDARQQSFEELYGPPENFLEIEVCMRCAALCCALSPFAASLTSCVQQVRNPMTHGTYIPTYLPFPSYCTV